MKRTLGAGAVAGTILSLFVLVPNSWYVTESDAYVFTPEPFAPRWIARVVDPVIAVVFCTLAVGGLYGLYIRDKVVAGSFLKLATGGLAVVDLCLLAFIRLVVATQRPDVLVDALYPIAATVLLGFPSALLVIGSLFATGQRYYTNGVTTLGLVFMIGPAGIVLSGLSSFLTTAPVLVLIVALVEILVGATGIDLIRRPERNWVSTGPSS